MNWFFIRTIILLALISLFTGGCTMPIGQSRADGSLNPISTLPSLLTSAPTFTPFQPISAVDLTASAVNEVMDLDDVQTTAGFSPAFTEQPDIPATPSVIPPVVVSPTPVAALTTAVSEPTNGSQNIWIDQQLPQFARENTQLPSDLTLSQDISASLRLEPGSDVEISRWVYALVAPFPTVPYGVSFEQLARSWQGENAGPFAGRPLLMDESTYRMLSSLWGEAGPGAVEIQPGQELLDYAWKHRPSWAIVPFEDIEPRWKVLTIGGQSPVRNDFDQATYPLVVPISIKGDPQAVQALLSQISSGAVDPLLPATNRDPNRLTVVAMTGVTALVRATAFAMEQYGILYPGKDVRHWLRAADLTHISNEVPFAQNCPYPNPVQQGMTFCSDPRYIKLLEDVGTDIVELTGDHFADWGNKAMKLTLKMYRERGWLYYGGGANIQEGRQSIIVEHNGNRLAFIGCNAKGGAYAQAGPDNPGAVVCDWNWMKKEVNRLRSEGYLPIVTFQHYEYYTYRAQKPQKRDSRAMAEAGAVIVSGSQAHQPQALEFTSGALIHYGLGNLFFDQYDVSYATRQAFIDRHVFYNGRHINSELLPILFIDYARPRPMTPREQRDLLQLVFSASGW